MADDVDLPPTDGNQVVERGQTYDHSEYGSVEVTGIWKGVQGVDEAGNTDETDVIIVRYQYEQSGRGRITELTDTLPEFLDAIE